VWFSRLGSLVGILIFKMLFRESGLGKKKTPPPL
jgi:hypothetical protein